ncbi:MAG: enoyl-CoA hydratase-related protein [Pseudomonadota bacterium]
MTDAIRLQVQSPLAEIILDKPEKRNALSVEMWAAIPDLIAAATQDSNISIVVIHGGASGAFAAGADISEFAEIYATPESAAASGRTIAQALNAVETCPKPVLAAIDGACVGAGVSLAMAADLRIASASARFGITPARLGLVYPAGDTRRLLAAIGPGAAKDLLFTGRIVGADEALSMRLIDRLVDTPTAIEAARALAGDIASVSQWSTRAIKAMIAGLSNGWADDSDNAQALFLEGFSNADFEEGRDAFLQKRPAKFTIR